MLVPAATEPVLVIGAGPVGQSVALLLARWGVPTVVLDGRSRREPVGSRSICQQRDVLDIWDSVGAGRIADDGIVWSTARTYYRDAELFSVQLAEYGDSPFPPFVNLSQSRTEEILDEVIAGTAGIDVRWDHEVTGLAQDADGVTLTCRTAAGPVTLTGRYAVACAGARGDAVRRALGVRFDGHAIDDQFLICDIETELPGRLLERRFFFDPEWNPGRQVLIHPCPGGTYRIDWQVPPDFDLAAERDGGGLDRRIRRIVGRRPYTLLWSSVYQCQSRLADRMRVGRVLLAGDCAHLMAPFGARGLNSGVADAENAGWKLAYVLGGWAGPELLESYHDERHAAARENLAVVDATMRFLAPGTDEERAVRETALAEAAENPEIAAERVDSGRLAEPFWYPDSPLCTPDPSRPAPVRPPRGHDLPPAPGVLIPDVPCVVPGRPDLNRLRRLARLRPLLVLVGPGVDPDAAGAAAHTGTDAPAWVYPVTDIDPTGRVAWTLGIRPGEVWLLRPDAHIAAILPAPTPADIAAAVRRCLGVPG